MSEPTPTPENICPICGTVSHSRTGGETSWICMNYNDLRHEDNASLYWPATPRTPEKSLEQRLTESHAEIARLREELASEKDEAESSLTGRMEYLAEMGFPYGCTWDEAIAQCKALRDDYSKVKEQLKISNDPDYAVLVYQNIDKHRAQVASLTATLEEWTSGQLRKIDPDMIERAEMNARIASENAQLRADAVALRSALETIPCPNDGRESPYKCRYSKHSIARMWTSCTCPLHKILATDHHPGTELLAAIGKACVILDDTHKTVREEAALALLAPYTPKQS